MDNLSRLLLKMFSLSLTPAREAALSPPLSLVSITALLNDILPGVLTSSQVDEIAQLEGQTTALREDASVFLRWMQRVNTIFNNQLNTVEREQKGGAFTHAVDDERLLAIEQAFDFLLTLNHALTSQTIESINLQPERIATFRYIESLRIDSDPAVVLIGLLPASLVKSSVQADLPDNGYQIIRKTDILYYSNPPMPRLNVKGRCRWSNGEQQGLDPSEWWQRPFQAWDLEVFSRVDKRIGKIETRCVPFPYIIHGKRLRLELPEQPGVVMYETRLLDQEGRTKALSLRLSKSPKSIDVTSYDDLS